MKRADIEALIEKLGIMPSKKLGQNFLLDENFLDCILREAAVQSSDRILEIGPGLGALTGRLLSTGAKITGIEFDRKLAAYLRTALVPRGLELIEGDACKCDLEELMGGADFRLISNLPYSAGTVAVANMLDLVNPPKDMLIMLQKEVALRFAAKPATEDYSSLSVRIQAAYDVRILRSIPPGLFYPRPEIDSALLRLTRRDDIPGLEFRRNFSRFVRMAFAHRRKKMFKQLLPLAEPEKISAAMADCGVDPDTRAERVSVEQFIRMAEILFPAS